ncbi:MAG TPA: S1/P1 nuclease [Bryobacteraceae bacterium]|nr:S1/P1 nuclease [Bryobacteraceae bacterium]
MPRFDLAVLLIATTAASAWGPEGHSLVARIAEAQLTPAARTRVTAILAPGQTLASVASWADEVRRSRPETANWHFVDIPIDQSHYDKKRDCAKDDCVVAKIADLRKTLKNKATPLAQQREALMFLVHFIGDMHQPLHCSDNQDHGGNSVRVVFNARQTNLHSLWDSYLLGRLAPADQLFPKLSQESQSQRKKFDRGSVKDWANESHHEAQKLIYGNLPKVEAGTPVPLDAAYEKLADPVIQLQIEKAGARLAKELNDIFR